MKKSLMILGSTLLSFGLVGCNANDNAGETNHNRTNSNNGGQATNTTNTTNTRNVNNAKSNGSLTISDRAERQVEAMKEVDDAHVIISNNDAYVTIRFANNYGTGATGTGNTNNNIGTTGTRNTTNINNATTGTRNTTNNTAGNQNGNTLMENGAVKPDRNNNGNNGIIDGKGDAGNANRSNTNTNNQGNNNQVIGTGNNNNANNGANGTNNGDITGNVKSYSQVSNNFEQRIADQVRKADNRIHKVYVSVNPDAYNRMGTYADDIRTKNGDREGLFGDFTNTVNELFGRNNR